MSQTLDQLAMKISREREEEICNACPDRHEPIGLCRDTCLKSITEVHMRPDLSVVKVSDVVKKVDELKLEIQSYEESLKMLRGSKTSWDSGIDNDKREPVKLLYSKYMELKARLQILLDSPVVLDGECGRVGPSRRAST